MEARTSIIRATNRMSLKIRDNFFTVEWCEERTIPEGMTDEEVAKERAKLWDICVQECERQCEDIQQTYGNSNGRR